MQDVSGFLASDGRFFFSPEECSQYESELARVSGIRDRCRSLLDAVRLGAVKNLPEYIQEYLNDPEDWFEGVWNEVVVPLLVPSDWDGDVLAATQHEFEIFEKRLNCVRLIVSYVLKDAP